MTAGCDGAGPDCVLRVVPEAGSEDMPMPAYATDGAAGLDLCAAVDTEVVLEAGARTVVPTGLRIAVPQGYEGQIRARSGIALRHGVGLANAPGTIDSDYRGPVRVILVNWGDEPFVIRRGDRIAQLVISPVARAAVAVVDSLDATGRGAGGFGSTGVAGAAGTAQ